MLEEEDTDVDFISAGIKGLDVKKSTPASDEKTASAPAEVGTEAAIEGGK